MERAPSTLFCPVSKSASESVCLSLHVHVCASAWERGNEKLSTFVWVFLCLYEGEQLQLARKTVSRVLFNSYIYFSTFSFSRPYYYFLQIDFFLPNKTFFSSSFDTFTCCLNTSILFLLNSIRLSYFLQLHLFLNFITLLLCYSVWFRSIKYFFSCCSI